MLLMVRTYNSIAKNYLKHIVDVCYVPRKVFLTIMCKT